MSSVEEFLGAEQKRGLFFRPVTTVIVVGRPAKPPKICETNITFVNRAKVIR